MPELPPRPGPRDQVLYLHRRPKSDFVNFPPFFQKRMVDGRARFMTKCDMLIGPCACGYTHTEDEGWVQELLQMYNCKIEPLILWGTELGDRGMVVEIPGYWKQGRNWERPRCDVLVGRCSCGRTHTANQGWVKYLLVKHGAVILNMPSVEEPNQPELPSQEEINREVTRQVELERPRRIYPLDSRWSESVHHVEDDITGENERFEEYLAAIMEGRMTLPQEAEERIHASASPECDCSECDRIRRETRCSVAIDWIRDCRMVMETGGSAARQWGIEHCNADGYLPYWCNCHSCRQQRLSPPAPYQPRWVEEIEDAPSYSQQPLQGRSVCAALDEIESNEQNMNVPVMIRPWMALYTDAE